MTSRRTKAAPAWTTKLIERYCAAIRKVAARRNLPMPLLEDRCATYKELGQGVYSVVFDTDSPDCAFKIGTDSSEFHFAQTAINWRKNRGFDPEGMIDFRAVYSLPEIHDGLDVFIAWREKASHVGLPETIAKSNTGMIQFVESLADYYDAADNAFFLAHQELTHYEDDVDKYWDWLEERVEIAKAMVDGVKAHGESKMADLLFKAYVAAEAMEDSRSGKYVGAALRGFFDRGILVADIHANNVGIAERGGAPTWIISDPGHSMVTKKNLAKIEIEMLRE